jgi:hypothetical protein
MKTLTPQQIDTYTRDELGIAVRNMVGTELGLECDPDTMEVSVPMDPMAEIEELQRDWRQIMRRRGLTTDGDSGAGRPG